MNPHVEVEIARRYLVGNWQSPSGGAPTGWSFDVAAHVKPPTKQMHWNSIPTRILTASPHLQGYDVPGEEIDRLKAEGLTLLEALERLGM